MELIWAGIHFRAFHESVKVASGQTQLHEYVWRIDGTRSIVVNKFKKILLTHEFRRELNDFDWRLPGGKLDSIDEPIIQAASRELKEETGVTANTWRYLWATTPDATVRFKRHFLFASDVVVGDPDPEEGENISISWFPRETIKEMALSGAIREEISALSLLRYIHSAP